jgi:hypothetical protein
MQTSGACDCVSCRHGLRLFCCVYCHVTTGLASGNSRSAVRCLLLSAAEHAATGFTCLPTCSSTDCWSALRSLHASGEHCVPIGQGAAMASACSRSLACSPQRFPCYKRTNKVYQHQNTHADWSTAVAMRLLDNHTCRRRELCSAMTNGMLSHRLGSQLRFRRACTAHYRACTAHYIFVSLAINASR